eukprot:3997569-Ditylum_brightwellii.AAC.1
MEKEVMETFMKALMCDTANDVNNEDKTYHYLYSKSTTLPCYLKYFCDNRESDGEGTNNVSNVNVLISEGPWMLICAGPGDGDHLFLEAEGSSSCASGSVCKYMTCTFYNKADESRKL